MKSIVLASVFLFASCATVDRVSGEIYKASCHQIGGDCISEMKKVCPDGYKVESKKQGYAFGGPRDEYYFSCRKRNISSQKPQ